MKNLIFIGGPMGVGKTTVSKLLQSKLDNCVMLDGDWVWYTSPWILNEETRAIAIDNDVDCLNRFINSTTYQNIIFCWVLHDNSIIDGITKRLNMDKVNFFNFSLVTTEEELVKRLRIDINNGIRSEIVIKRSLERLTHYKNVSSKKIDTTNKKAIDVACEIFTEVKNDNFSNK